jgi:germination protein M
MWTRKQIALSFAVLSIGMLTACGGSDQTVSIDPPQKEVSVLTTVDEAKTVPTTLYLKDANGYVAPVSVRLPDNGSPAKAVLEAMTAGTPKPAGFKGWIPAGTSVRGLNVVADAKLAVVDFSKEFLSYPKKEERHLVEAITYALTSFPTIAQVQLRVEGKVIESMPASGLPVGTPLTREMGVNVSVQDGVLLSQTTSVTVYYAAKSEDAGRYLVPVTRMVPYTNQPLPVVMQQLAMQPALPGLAPVLDGTTQATTVQVQNKVVKLNVQSVDVKSQVKLSKQAMQAIVWSMLDNADAKQVQVMVNQKAAQDKPVDKPEAINARAL